MDNKKNDISVFSLVEVYLILNPKHHIEKQCFKYIVLDLILKQVMKIEKVTKQASVNSKPYTFDYIKIGEQFLTYKPQTYEIFFLNPLKNGKVKVQLRYYGKNVLQKYLDNLRKLTKHVVKGGNLRSLMRPSIAHYFTGNFKLGISGKLVQNKFKILLDEIDELLLLNKIEAYKRFPEIGNNFLLLSNFDNSMFSELNNIFKELDVHAFSDFDYGSWGDSLDIIDLVGFDYATSCSSGCNAGCSSCSSGCSGCF